MTNIKEINNVLIQVKNLKLKTCRPIYHLLKKNSILSREEKIVVVNKLNVPMNEKVSILIKLSNKKTSQISNTLKHKHGILESSHNIHNKIKRNSIRFNDVETILKALGLKLTIEIDTEIT